MSLKVAFHLRRLSEPHAAWAVFVPSRDVVLLWKLCGRLGVDPIGRVHDVAGGFLLKLDEPTRMPLPGMIRLRLLAGNLFLPVDAELIPALLDDEAEGLSRDRGLIFLPGERVLAYDPRHPVDPAEWLAAPIFAHSSWRAWPEVAPLSEKIEEIIVLRPEETSEQVLDAGGEEDRGEGPLRPPDAGAGAKLLGGAAFGAGLGMAWLGKTLGFKGMAQLGAKWLGNATALVPRLSEAVVGRQAAALRALLQEFRDGNVDRALRHALPLGTSGSSRGAGQDPGNQLPPHGTAFSLRDLLETPNTRGGGVGVWYGHDDILAELTREYRKAAEEAARQGDYRRAAYIHGKLLRDYLAAVNVLVLGGFHHEAAILLLAKLEDPARAARAFVAAGEFDRAIQLYRELQQHEAAGDLLRRIGDEEAALAEYQRAADRLVQNRGYLAAGELLLTKVGRADLALQQFQLGWSRRPQGNFLQCVLRSAQLHAESGDAQGLFALITEADEHFDPAGYDTHAATFYNEIGKLSGHETLASARELLRNRALQGLALKLRQLARSHSTVESVLHDVLQVSNVWSAPLVNDASAAVASVLKRSSEVPLGNAVNPHSMERFRVFEGTVTAVCAAEEKGEIFLGFESGAVVGYSVGRHRVQEIGHHYSPVVSLVTDPEGHCLIILRANDEGTSLLTHCTYFADDCYRELHDTVIMDVQDPWLTPIVMRRHDVLVGMWSGSRLTLYNAGTFTPVAHIEPRDSNSPMIAAVVNSTFVSDEMSLYCSDLMGWRQLDFGSKNNRSLPGLHLCPGLREGQSLRTPPLSVRTQTSEGAPILILGITGKGELFRSEIKATDRSSPPAHTISPTGIEAEALARAADLSFSAAHTISPPTCPHGFVAGCLLDGGYFVGISRTKVHWFHSERKGYLIECTDVAIPSAIACFPAHSLRVLIVVCRDGWIVRVPFPATV